LDPVTSKSSTELKAAQPTYRSGAAQDERALDLEFEGLDLRLEALPAAWWNGDVSAFRGPLVFDPENPHGAQEMSPATGKVALVQRGGGKFAAKIAHARAAGARAGWR